MKKLYIYGSGGHALVSAEVAFKQGYEDIEFIDDLKKEYNSFEQIKNNTNTPFFVAIGNNKIREEIFNKIKKNNFKIVNLIDPSAIISKDTTIGIGNLIMANVVVNVKTKIGDGVILNSSCVVEHENIIEDFVHISPKVALAGNVTVKQNTHLGIGTCCIQNITIGENCTVGAGSVIVKDIPSNVKGYGNPFRVVKDLDE